MRSFFGVVLLQDFGQGSFPRDFFLCGESGYKGFRIFFFYGFSILSTEQIILLPNYYILRCTTLVWPRVCGCPFVCPCL